jgi:putative protein-disulfide isomerase
MSDFLNLPMKPELLYIHDPLCGWCYGMTTMIKQIQLEFGGIDVTPLAGGMFAFGQSDTTGEHNQYLRAALPTIEKVAGIKFGEPFKELLASGTYRYDSELPCGALTVFRQLHSQGPEHLLSFIHAVQTALFRDGQDLNDPTTYNALAKEFGLDVVEFQRRLALLETAAATRQEFAAVARTGIQGFPTVVLRIGEQGYVLARSYQPYGTLASNIEAALKQAADEGVL